MRFLFPRIGWEGDTSHWPQILHRISDGPLPSSLAASDSSETGDDASDLSIDAEAPAIPSILNHAARVGPKERAESGAIIRDRESELEATSAGDHSFKLRELYSSSRAETIRALKLIRACGK